MHARDSPWRGLQSAHANKAPDNVKAESAVYEEAPKRSIIVLHRFPHHVTMYCC